MAEGRRRRQRTLIRCPQLRKVVIDRLKHDWSPEQVAGRLKVDGIAPVTVSHETIYQFIYSKSGKALKLCRLLPSRRRKRVPRYARKARGNTFPDTVAIKHRPSRIS
jgi:IS30 family transposase